MRISPRLKADISKVILITIAFVLLNWFFTFYNDGLVYSGYSRGPTQLYNLKVMLLLNTVTGLIAGCIGGSAIVFVNNRYFRKKSYGYALMATFVAYSIVFIIVTLVMGILSARVNLGPALSFGEYYQGSTMYMFSKMALVYYMFWGTATLFIVLFLQISDKFGPGMLGKFLAGKYHQPREENRIFMFMDMKSSTTIAEKIGNKQYFNLLKDLFNDVTDAILSTEGEIYQYVGDEVVISWSLEKGMREANCIRCFEKVREELRGLRPYYEAKFGVVPTFKAGVHYGMVTAGEVGSIKKDIAYSGDVLNTASRIQEQCNHYDVDFLISKETLDLFGDDLSYEPVHLGNIELRGKKNLIDLNTLKSA